MDGSHTSGWWIARAAFFAVVLSGIIFLLSRTDSTIGRRLDRRIHAAGNSILSVDIAPVKALRSSRVAKLIPADSAAAATPDVEYVVTKRGNGEVSVTVPTVTRKTSDVMLQRIERSIGAREHARVVRLYGDRGELVGTFVGGVFNRAER
jgi:hypothetical protein